MKLSVSISSTTSTLDVLISKLAMKAGWSLVVWNMGLVAVLMVPVLS